jgi:hypothetical protein
VAALVAVTEADVLVEVASPPGRVAIVDEAPHSSSVSPSLQQELPLAQ